MQNIESIQIRTTSIKEKKISAIKACDSAFSISVVDRANFETLFHKIDTYADFIVATIDDLPIGYAALYANNKDSKEAFIALIGVDKRFQGNHVGKALMDNCVNISKQRGMRTIRLEVLDIDKGAQAFYSKQGFLEDGRCSSESIYMKKIISVE